MRELRAPCPPSARNSTVPADTLRMPALPLDRYHLRPESSAGAAEASSRSRWKNAPGSMRPVPSGSRRRHCRPSCRALIRGTSSRCRPMVSPSASAVRRSRATREEGKSVEARSRGGSATAPPRMRSSGGMSGRGRRFGVTVSRSSRGSSVRVAPRAGSPPRFTRSRRSAPSSRGHQNAVPGLILHPQGLELDPRPIDLDPGLEPSLRHLDAGDAERAAALPVRGAGIGAGGELRAPAGSEDVGGVAEVAPMGPGV